MPTKPIPAKPVLAKPVLAKPVLYVCHIDDQGPKPHACRRAHEALREAGHEYEGVIAGRGHYFGLFTKGRRPRLKQLSGQEKLPVLQLLDGTTIAGSSNIIAWARRNPPGPAPISSVDGSVALVEFPADDPERALRFWGGLLDLDLAPRTEAEGAGWQSRSMAPPIGIHARGRGPGDSFSLPYFAADDLPSTLGKVEMLGGKIVHPGDSWAICKDSEGNPFGLAANRRAAAGP